MTDVPLLEVHLGKEMRWSRSNMTGIPFLDGEKGVASVFDESEVRRRGWESRLWFPQR